MATKTYQIQKKTILNDPDKWVSVSQHKDLETAMQVAQAWITTMKRSKLPEFKDCQSTIRVVEVDIDVIQFYHYFIPSK